ncbi:SMP-30/gluconolactonase/LRE family protein [Phenylobacterium deserti]|uniref:SMP-30/gluconolactonase/LRE family protein n=1 Tax=Phenylobacterium deserti TaxID=1914756 RepID=UPI001402B43D|nr:SMP-30/gluconolactonase/LRE family protein [Phenylobacterium deserti]
MAQLSDRLGEGPLWVSSERRLWWFDIKGRRLSWHEPSTGSQGSFDLPVRASAAVVRQGGGLVLATERGLAAFDTRSGAFELVQPHAFEPGFRTNDGKIGPDGAFWWSIMDDEGGTRPGAVFRTTPEWRTERVIEGVHIANATAWTPNGERMFLADSKHGVIFAHDMADLSRRTTFVAAENGSPDGAAMDEEGFLWTAHWGGWRVVRYAPDGSVDRVVPVPVEQPTSCAFGGEDLCTLFVTSAWDELTPEARQAQPLAGALFAFEPGVRGDPLPTFAG